jgi:hypothetical protein
MGRADIRKYGLPHLEISGSPIVRAYAGMQSVANGEPRTVSE